jgi:uncharacterized phage protein gp47/JayE
MALALGLSDAGLLVPREADFLTEIRDAYKAATGLDIPWSDDLLLGVLTAIMANLLGKVTDALQAVYDAFDENNATGVQLANIARLVGVDRKKATHSQVQQLLTGTPGVVLPLGRLMEGGGLDGRARWRLKADTTIGLDGTVLADFEAEEAGRTTADPGDIDTIVTPVAGWTGGTNPGPASPGLDDETDDVLRVRRAESLQQGDGAGNGAIRTKLLRLSFIQSAAVIDNPDNEPAIVEGVGLPAVSVAAIVTPNPLTAEQKATLLRTLYDSVTGGTTTAGTESGTVIGLDGVTKTVRFYYAASLVANIAVTLTMAAGYTVADASPTLQALVAAHISQLRIGEPLRLLAIYALAATVPGVVAIEVLINGLEEDLDPSALQQVVLGTWSP